MASTSDRRGRRSPSWERPNRSTIWQTPCSDHPRIIGRHSPSGDRPNMSDLRIVLLGKNLTENSRVGNFIFGGAVFESEGPLADIELTIVIANGKLEDRDVTVINTPHLLHPDLSSSQITHRVKECVKLSAPGPHAIILVLQQNDFSEKDRNRVKYILNEFSKEVIKRTIVLTNEEQIHNDCIHQLIQECESGHIQFDERISGLESIEKILKEKNLQFHFRELYEETQERTSGDEEQSRSGGSVTAEEKDFNHKVDGKIKVTNKEKKEVVVRRNILLAEGVYSLPKLNVVLCGSDRTLKASISNLILNQRDRRPELRECVKLEGEVDGCLITLVELPALTQLIEEEVMCQTLRCVSLCDPGVHVFLFIVSDGPLTDEDRTETEEIQKVFSSKVNNHTMVLIIQKSVHKTEELNEEIKSVIDCFGGRHHFIGSNTHISMLVTELEQMVEENRSCYSKETFLDAQMEKFEEMRKKIISLETQIQKQDLRKISNDVRIVLLGKTGVGKSSTANTILGREAFKADVCQESVTRECQRETTEIDGRQITVIDTPGLFDTKFGYEENQKKIIDFISMILPGPHVFLLLIPVGHFTQEEENTVRIIQETFGENSLMYTMVLFTRGDELKKTIEEYLGKPDSALMKLIEQCGNRYHVFNNNEAGDRMQVSELLQKISDMGAANGGFYCTCMMFRQMEREKQEAQMKMIMDEVEELKREREELLAKHEEEKERMKMMMEEERQKSEEQYKTDMKREQEKWEKMMQDERQRREEEDRERREKEQNIMDNCDQRLKQEREEIKREKERSEREKEHLQAKHEMKIQMMNMKMEEERQLHDTERRRREEEYKTEMKREQEKWEKMMQDERQRREEEDRKRRETEQNIMDNCDQRLKQEREEIKREKERSEREKEHLQAKHEMKIQMMNMKMEEERQLHDTERRRREEEYKTEMKREQEKWEKMMQDERQRREEEDRKRRGKEQNIMDNCDQRLKQEREEIKREKERSEREKEHLQAKHEMKIQMMNMKMEEERQLHDTERRRREEEYKTEMKREEKLEKMMQDERQRREEEDRKRRETEQNIMDNCDQRLKQEREELKREKERTEREKEDLQAKHEMKIQMMNKKMEEERQLHDTERRRREEEYKTEMKREQEKWEKMMQDERQRREEEDRKRRETEQNIMDNCDQRLKQEREELKREKERIEKEKQDLQAKYELEIENMTKKMKEEIQNHETERRRREEELSANKEGYRKEMKEKEGQMQKHHEEEIQHEKSQREQQRIIYEDQLRLEKQKRDKLTRQIPVNYEDDRGKDIENMKMCCSHQTASSLQRDGTDQNSKFGLKINEQLKELYNRLSLTQTLKDKMRTTDILKVTKSVFLSHEPQKENELVDLFLQKLMSMDYSTRYTVIKHRKKEGDQKTPATNKEGKEDSANYNPNIHPMDVQMAVFHCADGFLKQLMVTKLSQCQYALPLLVPDPFTQQIEFPLWTFRQIIKSWKMKNSNNEIISQTQPVYKAETSMVAFFRFGYVSSSKSQLMNSLINEKHHTFFHRNCPGSSRTRLLMDGVVEIAWYCPSGEKKDAFDDCFAFCNLHGDAAANEKQYEILTSMASVNVLFLPDFGQKNHYKGLVRSLFKSPQPLICLLTDSDCDKTELGNGKCIIGLSNKNQADVSEQIRETVKESLTKKKKTFKLKDVAEHTGIRVDEDDPECQRGKQAADQIMGLLRGKKTSAVKETILPCQGKLWHDWCEMNKELRHLEGENLEEDKSIKLKNMREIRGKQVEQGLSEFMKAFIKTMTSQKDNEKNYFLRWMKNLLDDYTSDELCRLHKEYHKKWHEVLTLKKLPDKLDQLQTEQTNLENISEQINRTSLGLEHILREFGQIYESWSSVKKNQEDSLQFDFCSLPSLAAEMMISGFPMELMDGDAAHVPLTWITAVLDELVKKLGNQKLFVLSILGIQSSGKSTMLNAMFGLQFAVSAGRCTRGAFMQLIKVSEEMEFDYILVVDTEGLRAPELAGRSTTHRDNEMATFVVGLGNMTLINIFGENPSEMQDILQIVVQAFLRMKKVRLNPSCMFVHQNVSDITAGEKNMEGRRQLQNKLDNMTALAAKVEVCDAEGFSDVIRFDVENDVKYFAQLWQGSPPMAPPNPNYCENILELKQIILTHASKSDGIMLTHLRDRVHDLWEALLNEQFVFSFKNSLEIATYKKLETEYSKWTWSLRSAMLEIENKLHNKIENKVIHSVEETDLQTQLKAKSEEVKKTMSELFEKDRDAGVLNQWKASFEIKIKELQENIVRETKRKLNEVLQQREMKKKIDAQRRHHENTLFEKSKELALKFKDQANDGNHVKVKFDSFWKQQTAAIISDTPKVKDIDILRDVKKLLNQTYESLPSGHMKESSNYKDMFSLTSSSEYVKLKKSSGIMGPFKNAYKGAKEKFGLNDALSKEDEVQIRALITDIADQTDKMIQSFNIAKLGYNISCIQQLTDYITARLNEHQEGPKVKYVLKREFFVDLVLCICHKANKTFTDQYKMFREANDPVLYFERKSEEYYSIFQKYCQGATSTAIFGEFVCNKLKESIQKNVYKTTARDLANEITTNCESLNGNRSNLEKHILKTLAEKQDFKAYMNYIKNPKEHFKNFIRDEVSQYINERFEDNVRPKMENNIKLLEQQITEAAQESAKQTNADLWLHHFTQQLSHVLIFSESDLTGVNHDDVDVSFLEDVIRKKLPSIKSDIISKFSTETFPVKLEHKDRPDEILIDHFCDCCWVQCPFCAAICTNTIEDHPGDHSVPFHRNTGLTGFSYRGTTNLSISICTSAVASDRSFYPNSSDDTVPWKEYRKGGPKYASWSITPDLSELPYWKWFVCRFQTDLENHYKKTYDGSGKIPDEWRKYSPEEAIESLNKYI